MGGREKKERLTPTGLEAKWQSGAALKISERGGEGRGGERRAGLGNIGLGRQATHMTERPTILLENRATPQGFGAPNKFILLLSQ
jgi:hypothetical protein